MNSKTCSACGRKLKKRSPDRQTYCSTSKCQRERRRRWQRNKRKSDLDYKDNQARAQQAWMERNPNYWKDYRRRHPEYTEKNRQQAKVRRENRKSASVAKMDSPRSEFKGKSGTYLLTPLSDNGVAKMDAWTVEIRFISEGHQRKKESAE